MGITNFEKYKDKIMTISIKGYRVALVQQQPVECHNISCTACDLYCEVPCDVERLKWLYEEYKEPTPRLTLEERHFCEILSQADHPIKIQRINGDIIILFDVWGRNLGKKYFQFMKDGEPWFISDLLKLEVEK